MALQIWLPLNGNIENKGLLGDLTVTETPTFADAGKIGKCLSSGSLSMSAEQTQQVLNNDEFTFDYDYYIEFVNEPMLWLDGDKQVKTLNTFVMYDYGKHIEGKVTTLLDGNLIWFNPKDYGIDTLVAGDELVIEYTGEFIAQDI